MTRDELVAIASAEGLTAGDVEDLLAAPTADDARLVLEGILAAGRGPDETGWQRLGAAFEEASRVAGVVTPIVSVIAAAWPLL